MRSKAVGLSLKFRIGNDVACVVIGLGTEYVRVSLRTSDPRVTNERHCAVLGQLEAIWRSLRLGIAHAEVNEAAFPIQGKPLSILSARTDTRRGPGQSPARFLQVRPVRRLCIC